MDGEGGGASCQGQDILGGEGGGGAEQAVQARVSLPPSPHPFLSEER